MAENLPARGVPGLVHSVFNSCLRIGMDIMNELAPRYLDTRQAAVYLGLGPTLLKRMRATGEGPPYVRAGRRVIYDRFDLDDWMARRKRGLRPERIDESEPAEEPETPAETEETEE